MPWTTADVDRHRKGLTENQKKTWCRIANGTRESCMRDNGESSYCDALAIRVANKHFAGKGKKK
jgi:hypothetical protein